MNESIKEFLQECTCASICCIDADGEPYCFCCFYAFNTEEGILYFKSSNDTHHAQMMKNHSGIAGTVLPDKLNKLVIKGIQFEGRVLPDHHPLTMMGQQLYLKKYPVSIAIPGEVWAVQLNSVKLTDSSKVFGKKTSWNRDK